MEEKLEEISNQGVLETVAKPTPIRIKKPIVSKPKAISADVIEEVLIVEISEDLSQEIQVIDENQALEIKIKTKKLKMKEKDKKKALKANEKEKSKQKAKAKIKKAKKAKKDKAKKSKVKG